MWALALIGNLDAEQLKAPAICTAQNPSGRGIAFSGGKCEGRQEWDRVGSLCVWFGFILPTCAIDAGTPRAPCKK